MLSVVLVIDLTAGFFEEGNPLYLGRSSRDIIPNVERLLEEEQESGSKIFYLCDQHLPDDPEFKVFPPHCIAGTRECEVIPELSSFPGEIIPKRHFNGFTRTSLGDKLEVLGPDKLIICGVWTDICVLHTAAEARTRGYEVEIPSDCVFTPDRVAQEFALEHMRKIWGIKLTRSPQKIPSPRFKPSPGVISGETTDIYFARTVEILNKEGVNPVATMEVFSGGEGVLCGVSEVQALLKEVLPPGSEVWSLREGERFHPQEVVLRIKGPYQSYGMYETTIVGNLAQCSGWTAAAHECVEEALGIPIMSFGARHVHPQVAGIMDYCAVVGGCVGCSSIAGAKLCDLPPMGTMPHALIITLGSTVEAALTFHKHMPEEVPRIALVDTFKDEAEESVLVASAMKGRLEGVRLDTPSERGRVTPSLVKEVRRRLDLAGFGEVKVVVSGGIDPQRIAYFIQERAPVDMFGVGSYISDAKPIDFTADIHELEGKPIAKRGRIPGVTVSHRLERVI